MHTLFLMLLLAASACAAPPADLVTSLPDFPGPLASKHYSGYLDALNGSHLHYYFVEAIDVPPATAPVVLWLNGGPGCSSMDGWGYEHGPFHFKDYDPSKNKPTFSLNNYTWARIANIIFIESPPGVGFSWSDSGNYTTTDSFTALNSHAALVTFFKLFPEFSGQKFYISGESYAGIYVPTLAWQVMTQKLISNFMGVLVGDGVTDYRFDTYATGALPFAYGHNIIDKGLYDDSIDACVTHINQAKCDSLQSTFQTLVSGLDIYGIYLDCFNRPTNKWKYIPNLKSRLDHMARTYNTDIETLVTPPWKRITTTIPPGPPNGEAPCVDDYVMEQYLNRPDVKTALHVQPSLTWSLCFNINYISDVDSVLNVYTELLAQGKQVLVYNGNTDMSVPGTGTQAWIDFMNWTTTSPFHSWTYQKSPSSVGTQVGGSAVQYEKLLWFVRVNGAGHMVPQTRPQAAYDMFERFMSGRGF